MQSERAQVSSLQATLGQPATGDRGSRLPFLPLRWGVLCWGTVSPAHWLPQTHNSPVPCGGWPSNTPLYWFLLFLCYCSHPALRFSGIMSQNQSFWWRRGRQKQPQLMWIYWSLMRVPAFKTINKQTHTKGNQRLVQHCFPIYLCEVFLKIVVMLTYCPWTQNVFKIWARPSFKGVCPVQ